LAEELSLSDQVDRKIRYQELLPQLKGLASGESNLVANLANVAAALRQAFNFFWVGFYLVEGDELVLGPFQGDVACTRIAKGYCRFFFCSLLITRAFAVPLGLLLRFN